MIFRFTKNSLLPLWLSTVHKGLMLLHLSMPVKSNQYRGTIGVFNNRNFTMIRDESRCLGKFSPNFLMVFMGFFVGNFFYLYSYLQLVWFSLPPPQKRFCKGLQFTTVVLYISHLGSLNYP